MPDLGFVLEDRFLEVGISGCEGRKAAASSTCTLGGQKAVPFRLFTGASQLFLCLAAIVSPFSFMGFLKV